MFVRGLGDDRALVAAYRHGIRNTVAARMGHIGREADIRSVPDERTQVGLIRSRPDSKSRDNPRSQTERPQDLPSLRAPRARGDAAFSPMLAGFVLDAFTGESAESDEELDRLSPREREVMRLIARGFTYREAASELFLSVKTIETHVSSVLRKLQLSDRHELARWASARRLT